MDIENQQRLPLFKTQSGYLPSYLRGVEFPIKSIPLHGVKSFMSFKNFLRQISMLSFLYKSSHALLGCKIVLDVLRICRNVRVLK